MPELPEVEVVKKSLVKNIIKCSIKRVKINNPNLRYKVKTRDFNKILKKKIISIKRISKFIIINFENNFSILAHLGMTGKFFIKKQTGKFKNISFYYTSKTKRDKHDHIIFTINNKFQMIYNDVRRFGFIKVQTNNELKKSKHFIFLGPDPLSKKFNIKYLFSKIKNTDRKIKDVLMDQKFVSGLGNIYVNEILFKCKINPKRKIKFISKFEAEKLIFFTRSILKESIKFGGSTIKDFEDDKGNKGKFQQKFNVYGRANEKCLNSGCSLRITKDFISKRSTYYCKFCQKY